MNSRSLAWLVGGLVGVAIVAAALVCARVFVANPYRVPAMGMYPTIKVNDVVWGYRLAYRSAGDVKRADVVVHTRVQDGKKYAFVKRVIGIPGDHIRTVYDRVFVNDRELPRQAIRSEPDLVIWRETNGGVSYSIALMKEHPRWGIPDVDVVVPAHAFFMLGDNRMNSLDSRYVGCIPWHDVVGKVVFGTHP